MANEVKKPKIAGLKELVKMLGISIAIQNETSDILEDYEHRIYSLEEDRKRLLADYRAQHSQIVSLEKRYSELLYKFAELNKK